MKQVVFRNYDRYAIKHLLMEIGHHRLHRECQNRKLNFPKRISLFFLESGDFPTTLKYKYPMIGINTIMVIDRYDLPEKGWERFEVA
ncbi:hypothetical protein NYZ99_15330 [Maribacter litopenaei]|uniref:IrrE N-terminal-like domain-containing protein n=1 Tax=Maribacter litopenaei TaxID=2976127 RepID=A0ABY5Y5L5_9FLAO|nr:hypothetical protein [Maribacter litopenaei]UWX54310.1 hypothetical protein NYZ99_15330 [Maribacter litopenaei]